MTETVDSMMRATTLLQRGRAIGAVAKIAGEKFKSLFRNVTLT